MRPPNWLFLVLLGFALALFAHDLRAIYDLEDKVKLLEERLAIQDATIAAQAEKLETAEAQVYVIRRTYALNETGQLSTAERDRTTLIVLHASLDSHCNLRCTSNWMALVVSILQFDGRPTLAEEEVHKWNAKFPNSQIE